VGRGQGWGDAQSCADDLHDTVDVSQNLVVPKSKHAVAVRVEKFGSPVVRSGAAHLVVLPAINFDHKAPLMAGEICEK
jgi:hypothetical protein